MRKSRFRWSGLGVLLFACLLALSVTPMEGAEPAKEATPRSDRYGDPLPDGAVARLGTVRWRYPNWVELVHFLKDGKQVLSFSGDGIIRVSDAATGKEIRRFGNASDGWHVAISGDENTLAHGTGYEEKVLIWNVSPGKETCSFDHGMFQLSGLGFIKGEKLIGWGQSDIKVWDVETGKLSRVFVSEEVPPLGYNKRTMQGPQWGIENVSVSPDGTMFAVIINGSKGDALHATLSTWSLKDGKPMAEVRTTFGVSIKSVFSPDSKYIAGPAGDGRIQLYESATLKKVRLLGEPMNSIFCGASFSNDGKLLAVVYRSGTICLLEVATGKKLREIGENMSPDKASWGNSLSWSPDSKLIAQSWRGKMIRVWDVETGKGNESAIAHFGNISGLIVSVDGKSAITSGGDGTVRTWDVPAAAERRKVSLPPKTTDCQLLDLRRALLRDEEGFLSVWDLESEKELVKIQRRRELRDLFRFDVTRDRRSLFVAELPPRMAHLSISARYDLETGREKRGVEKNWTKDSDEGIEELFSLAHASKGQLMVATIRGLYYEREFGVPSKEDQTIIRVKRSEKDITPVWEISAPMVKQFESLWAASFTPDDRAILTLHADEKMTWISLLEAITGKERCRFDIAVDFVHFCPKPHAYSRNGDLAAVVTKDGIATVIDIRLGRKLTTLMGDQGTVCSLAFGADMATLYTGGSDGTVLIWDLREHLRMARQTVELTPAETKRLWNELADPDAVKAYQALGTLVTAPAQAVALFREKLKPVQKRAAAEVDQLIADLDNNEFETREKASRELRRLSPQGKDALQKCLETSRSAEQRRRVKELLAELKIPGLDELRELRAIEVLETIGTPPARSLLESLAKGASGTRLTDEAAATLGRLDKK